jgi:hypothetical protein
MSLAANNSNADLAAAREHSRQQPNEEQPRAMFMVTRNEPGADDG